MFCRTHKIENRSGRKKFHKTFLFGYPNEFSWSLWTHNHWLAKIVYFGLRLRFTLSVYRLANKYKEMKFWSWFATETVCIEHLYNILQQQEQQQQQTKYVNKNTIKSNIIVDSFGVFSRRFAPLSYIIRNFCYLFLLLLS